MKKIDQKLIGIIGQAMLGLALPAAAFYFVKFKPPLTEVEKSILAKTPTVAALTVRQPLLVSQLNCPVEAKAEFANAPIQAAAQAATPTFPPVPLPEVPPPDEKKGKQIAKVHTGVSMILVNDGVKLAIIDGKVLREGDRYKEGLMSRIERDKVLLKSDKGEKWLRIN